LTLLGHLPVPGGLPPPGPRVPAHEARASARLNVHRSKERCGARDDASRSELLGARRALVARVLAAIFGGGAVEEANPELYGIVAF
jgi:hypothetical protein